MVLGCDKISHMAVDVLALKAKLLNYSLFVLIPERELIKVYGVIYYLKALFAIHPLSCIFGAGNSFVRAC